jgi:hypothetical protein
MQEILGVDFSGAALAGRKIWVSRATLQNDILHIAELKRGADLLESGEDRETVFPALVNWITSFGGALCGMDFPFALSAESVGDDWRLWLQKEVVSCADADVFRSSFPDERRRCDIQAKTPFSPLNKRLYRQTFHGLRDVICPLLQRGALALPFDAVREGALCLLEICPASLLKRENLYLSYKGQSAAQKATRALIWDEMQKRSGFQAPSAFREAATTDYEGDSLDAVLAALCTHRALQTGALQARYNEIEKREGHVYF